MYKAFRDKSKLYLSYEDIHYIHYIDLNDAKFKHGFTADRFMDEMHLDAQGNNRLAEIVAKIVTDEKLL